ncbi:hypothetical protein GCM10011529_24270 [Polymorphobacter glacialis]|uniref:DUF2218 domain-containing protein n=1 Tax=Sandarakinorhabdus glacialis TaxID=1614636 RepID=A0A917E9J5_9SPHN|nr:DUF2218 domain-containing protein [Polymorphobacter glacialis]GGE16963.1 hypothetical protein GCM10011529_24270 [Polymorphobacter glacialis]
MSVETRASVPTVSGSRYLQQLCKHWAHKFAVAFDATAGTVPFTNGAVLTMTAEAEVLQVQVTAPDAETAVSMQGVVARHLDRFAFREAPLAFDWSEPV